MSDLLKELALAKLEFQLRAIKAVIVAPHLEVAETRPKPEGKVDAAAILRALSAQRETKNG